jgi:hypothetical protein
MLRKALGKTGSRRWRWSVTLSLMVVAAASLMVMQTLLAVHLVGGIELDGNATTDSSHDWDQVFNDVQNGTNTSGATAVSFADDGDPNATIFTGGGSKDPSDLNEWAWKDGAGGLPDKDNLVHSFAARYSFPATDPALPNANCTNGTGGAGQPAFDPTIPCEVLYFGSDRFDNSGDAQQGFWFFQNRVSTRYDSNGDGTLDADCPQQIGGGTGFCDPVTGEPAVHRAGDLLIISDFSNGGTVSTITIYVWDPTQKNNLRLLQSQENANCATADDNDPFCGLVNPDNGTPTGGWSFTDKSGNTSYLQGEFFEGGVNLSSLGLGAECFASVASESRSSTSTTAVLKDFVLGQFGECATSLVTTPKDGTGGDIPAGGLSIGTGSVSVTDSAQLTVNGIQVWTGNLTFFLCGPIATGTCTTGGTQIGSPIAVSNLTPQPILSSPATLTSAGRYCWRGEFDSATTGLPDAADASEGECFVVNPVLPSIPTQASPDVLVGNPISDTTFLTGTASQPGSPIINGPLGAPAAGLITFQLFGPNDATCSGTPVFTSAPVPVAGDGPYTSGNFIPTEAGTYRWVASYSGNAPNTLGLNGVCNAANENVVVSPKQPSIATVATAPPPNGAPLGTTINDTATLSGTSTRPDGSPAGGTITFTLYGPVATNTPTCTVVVGTSVVGVSGDGNYVASTGTITGTLTPTAPGFYFWIAVYSGDLPNTLGVSGQCGDPNETSLLIRTTITTAQTFTIQDSATISATGGGDLAGGVRFRLFQTSNCTGGTLVDQTVPVAGASPQIVSTTPVSITTSQPVLSWLVEFTSTNPAQGSQTSACNTENASLSITNGPQ